MYRTVVKVALTAFRIRRWKLRVTGHEHVPESGGAIIATNHIGYIDFVFVGAAVNEATRDNRLVRFAAKSEAFDHRLSGPLMRAMKHISVDRAGAAHKTIDQAVDLLTQGELVGMFPEATVSRAFVPLPAKTGTVRIAQQAGVPIIPGAVWGCHRLSTKGRRPDLRSNVVVSVDFGPPMYVGEDEDRADATTRMMATIGDLVAAAQERYPQRPDGEDDRWWLPAHLGGTAPTVDEAMAMARAEAEERMERRRAERIRRRAEADAPPSTQADSPDG